MALGAGAWWARLEALFARHARWISIALVLLATARIAGTYSTLSHTFDEPAHLAAGMEWIEQHRYAYEAQHPPLTRAMIALPPWLSGVHGAGQPTLYGEGLAILGVKGQVDRTLTLARTGTLPFFWLTCGVVFAMTRWMFDSLTAVLAIFLLTMTPSILAHAGLATTDMGLTGCLLLALYTGWRWLDEPGLWRAAFFGASLGLAVLAKFSTLAFFPAAAIIALLGRDSGGTFYGAKLLRHPLERGGHILLSLAIALLAIWAGYWFSFGMAMDVPFPVPAPELLDGIKTVRDHNAAGHLTYLLGSVNTSGWPYFYVVALGVKTPLSVLALALVGLAMIGRQLGGRSWILPSAALGILAFSSFFSRIMIGTRHVLPVFAVFAMAGAHAAAWLLRREGSRIATAGVAVLFLCTAVSSARVHPDYLSYFNLLAGDTPEDVLVDSDLDWGQDVKRLARRLKEVGAEEVFFGQYVPGDLPALYGFPRIRPLDASGPQPGWNAVSVTLMKYGVFGRRRFLYDRGFRFWPEQLRPVERVGSGILLFHVPPPG